MDMSRQRCGSSSSWTNEKHLRYLNSVEASFVRTMLDGNSGGIGHLRLDRYMPDSSESTRDLKVQRKKKLHATVGPPARINGAADKKQRRLSSPPSRHCSHDQVIPQLISNEAADEKHDDTTDTSVEGPAGTHARATAADSN
ncbi:uncharacterized protein LOC116195265 isoform X2 [Punica granatum]|uniref:Uncharacterized protein LOC116195265 isoform X2 n=1 Tax=Punica granatum TaxID=22663 RepID=A0A6P8C8Z2_PUNGR|nr:uncharacterized protein LOC116195265 isoform X2 [Punica granatum]